MKDTTRTLVCVFKDIHAILGTLALPDYRGEFVHGLRWDRRKRGRARDQQLALLRIVGIAEDIGRRMESK